MIGFFLAPVVELVDTQVLGTCAKACRFESDRGQNQKINKKKVLLPVLKKIFEL